MNYSKSGTYSPALIYPVLFLLVLSGF